MDKVEITDYSAKTTATAGQLRADAEAMPGIRLIDPTVVGPAFEQLQQVRGYYTFPRPSTSTATRSTAPRPTPWSRSGRWTSSGIEGQNWNNLRTVYTHGYGLVAAYGNKRQVRR